MFRPMLCSYLNFQRSGGFGLFKFILNHQFPILWGKTHGIDELANHGYFNTLLNNSWFSPK